MGSDFYISDFAGTDAVGYAALQPFTWPANPRQQGGRFFGTGHSNTPDGKARVRGDWRAELAGKTRPGDWVSAARAHFGLPQTAVLSVTDQVRGRGRVAFHRDGRLVAALFAGPVPIALARDQLAARLGLENPQDALAGRARADMPDPGPTVCVCATVGLNTIRHAVESGRATSLAALGESLGAGASCGSCRPKLAGPIARFRQRDVAE